MHRLLSRQLSKVLREAEPRSEEFARFLTMVSDAYEAADNDRNLLEGSLNIASEELYERNRKLEGELEERKRLEVELQLAGKMRAVGVLAAGVAHEINTPVQFIGDSMSFLGEACGDLLSLIDTVCAAAAQGIGADDAARFSAHADSIELSYLRVEIPRALSRCSLGIERVTKIVRALKELSHPDSATQEFADLNAAIENTLVVSAHEIKYVADVELSLLGQRHVRCHVGEIQQVMLNLLINAAHAIAERLAGSDGRGTISVSTREEGDDFLIVIGDNGAGIAPTHWDRVFEPFFTTKPVGKGTGQGLSIARVLITERHGGRLSFESELGSGTTFTIRLPVAGRPVAKEKS